MICMRESEADFAAELSLFHSIFKVNILSLLKKIKIKRLIFFSCTVSTSMHDMLGFLKTYDLDCKYSSTNENEEITNKMVLKSF